MNAPERIWAFWTPDDFDDDATITAYETVQHGGAEYTRADISAALVKAAREKALMEAAGRINKFLGLGRIGPSEYIRGQDECAIYFRDTILALIDKEGNDG